MVSYPSGAFLSAGAIDGSHSAFAGLSAYSHFKTCFCTSINGFDPTPEQGRTWVNPG